MRPLVPFTDIHDGHILARALVDTIREPLLVLDGNLHVIAASRSFLRSFKVSEQDTSGRLLYELGDGQWQIPELRVLLDTIIPQATAIEDFEVEHDFPTIGVRKIVINARTLSFGVGITPAILLAMEDVTVRRQLEKQKDDLQTKTAMLLNEMQHRIANSLQIIASILLLKAKSVSSDETRSHLLDAHQRVRAIAEIQRHLQPSVMDDHLELAPYLSKLCDSVAASMVGKDQPHTITTHVDEASATSSEAVSLGLVTTELIINSLKHAFTDGRVGNITVTFARSGLGWRLAVADNGIGLTTKGPARLTGGLGATIVESLARQLRGSVSSFSSPEGTCILVTMGPLAAVNPTEIASPEELPLTI